MRRCWRRPRVSGAVERDSTQSNMGVLVSSLTGGITDADPARCKASPSWASIRRTARSNIRAITVPVGQTFRPCRIRTRLLLPADSSTRVRLAPSDAYLGTISDAITFRAWDQTSGTADSYASAAAYGGTSSFSSATNSVAMTIDPAVGAETQANSDSAGSHTVVGTALDGQGNSVDAWTIYSSGTTNLFAQGFQRSGAAIGSQFQINPAGQNVSSAAVAMNTNGTSIFVWSTYSGGSYTVYSQRFNNSTGVAIDASPVSLFSGAAYPQDLSVGIAASGGYVVGYYSSSGSTYTVSARVYSASNVLQTGSPITIVTTTSPSYIESAALSVAADGSFVVEWESYASSSYQLQALRYTASGAPPR